MTANILNPKWPYTNSVETNLRKTFARVRKQMAEEQKRIEADKAKSNVSLIVRAK